MWLNVHAQRQGNAAPSLAAEIIETLPNVDDERYAEEERLAQDIAAAAYSGKSFFSQPHPEFSDRCNYKVVPTQ
jgi:hypothetical protein